MNIFDDLKIATDGPLCKTCKNAFMGACTLPRNECRYVPKTKPEEKERKCDFESFYKNANDNDCMAYLHCGKYVVPIRMNNIDIDHSNAKYPEFTLKGRWMAGSSMKDPSITISKVIFNPPATIVFWKDGSKTVVKCQDGDVFDPEKGVAMAFMKKACGNTGKYCNEVKKWVVPYYKDIEKIADMHDWARVNVMSADDVQKVLDIHKEEKENDMKRTLTRITTVEITEVIDISHVKGDSGEIYDDGYKRTMTEYYKTVLGVDDVVITKVQGFVSENPRK
jgi:hypothetical protein